MTADPCASPGRGARPDVVGLGEAMVVLHPESDDLATANRLLPSVAGAELNACAAVAALGGRATFVTRLGDDPFADRIRRCVRRLGVDLVADVDHERPTGVFFKQPTTTSRRSVYYYRAGSAAASLDESITAVIERLHPRAVLVSGLTAALGDGGPARALEAVAAVTVRSGSHLVLDANLRPALGVDRSIATLHALLPHARILILGTDEGGALFGTDDPERIIGRANAAGCPEVVVKAGAEGSFHRTADGGLARVPAEEVEVIDTVGAGDAFTGAYLWARLLGASADRSARLATKVAGMVVAALGDTEGLPGPADRERLWGHHPPGPIRGLR